MIGRGFVRFFYLISILLIFQNELKAQVDTKFWFVAPEVSNDHGDDPIYLNISTFDEAATVTISMPANGDDFPTITRTIAANSFHQENLTSYLSEIEHKFRTDYDPSIPGKSDQGILIESNTEITVYYESAYSNNSDLFSLKGNNALGSEFYTPFQTRYYNNSGSNWADPAYSAFDIVFTEDNTYITLEIPSGKAIYNGSGGWTGTVRLGPFNRGETFSGIPEWLSTYKPTKLSNDVFGRGAEDHLAGVHIKAHDLSGTRLKRIAITIKDDSMRGYMGSAYDLGGDQIVPLDIIGKEYIAMKGQLREGNVGNHYSIPPAPSWARQEVIFILATEDNTSLSIQGAYVTTLDEGETYTQELINNFTHVEADKSVYVWQVTGFGDEMGAAILPAIDRCTGSKKVAFSRSIKDWDFYMNILVRTGAENSFRLNGNSVQTSSYFQNVTGTSEWKAARIGPIDKNTIKELEQSVLENTQDVFHLGIIMGNSAGCRIGYFSGFGDIPQIEENPLIEGNGLCAGNIELSVSESGTYTTYNWYKNNTLISGENSELYSVSDPGRYKVTAITTCGGKTTETFPSNEIDVVPCLSIEDNTANEADPNAVFTVNVSHTLPLTDLVFEYETYPLTAGKNKDYVYTRGTATLPAGNSSVTISVPIKQDFINEPTEQFGMVIRNVNYVNIGDSTGVCYLEDDYDPEPDIDIDSVIILSENIGGGQLIVPVTLSEESGYSVRAVYTISDITAKITSDYNITKTTDTLVFSPGAKEDTIIINIVNDNIYEPSSVGYENFRIVLNDQEHCTAGVISSEVRITDDETIPDISVSDESCTEGDSLVFLVELTNKVSEDVTIDVSATDVSAIVGHDYIFNPTSQTITVYAGNLSTELIIPVVEDTISEGMESFLLSFSNAINANLENDPFVVSGTLFDDSGEPQIYVGNAETTEGGSLEFTVHLSIVSSTNVTFEYVTVNGSAVSPTDFSGVSTPIQVTMPAGDVTASITINTNQDTDEEGDENFQLILQNLTGDAAFADSIGLGTIEDDDETPVANDDNYSVYEDAVSPLTGNVTYNDMGLGDTPISLSLQSDVSHGVLTFNADGSFSYVPETDFHGIDQFSYRVTDADNDIDDAIAIINVISVNDIPVAADDAFGTIYELTNPLYSQLTGNILSNDSGMGDSVSIVIVSSPAKGTLSMSADGSFTYDPTAQKYGTEQFSYQLKDKNNELSDVTIVSFSIAYYNDAAPVANNDSYSTPQDSSIVMEVLSNDTDIDGKSTIDVGSIQIHDQPDHGMLLMDLYTGYVTYTPDAGYIGADYFIYSVADQLIEGQAVKRSNQARVDLTITVANAVPVAVCKNVNLYLDESGKVTLYATDLDGGSTDADVGDVISFAISGDTEIDYTCSNLGEQTLTLTVSDNNLAQSTCQSTVSVYDTISPIVVSCTSDTTVLCAPSSPGVTVTYSPPVFSDNCIGTTKLVSGQPSGTSFSVGVTTVEYNFYDASGNDTAKCVFNIEVVKDNELPVISGISNDTLRVNQINNTYVVSDNSLNPSATDNAGIASLTHNYLGRGTTLNGVTFTLGTHTVIWTATDVFGNKSQFTQVIVIIEKYDVVLTTDKTNNEACEGDPVVFTATPQTGGTSPYTYVFYVDGEDKTGVTTNNTFTTNSLTDSQVVSVKVVDSLSFKNNKENITISILPLPDTQEVYRKPND